ncbi:tyrosine-type recombinase/integrase [Desulfosporosinus burensis]
MKTYEDIQKEANGKNKNLNGLGSLRYKTDTLIEGRAMVKGKAVSVYVLAKSKGDGKGDLKAEKEARKQLNLAIYTAEHTGVVESRMTLQDWMKNWVELQTDMNILKEKSYGDYVSLIESHISETNIGRTEISKLTATELQAFYIKKFKFGRKPKKAPKPKRTSKRSKARVSPTVPASPVTVDTSLSLGTIRKIHALIRASLNDALSKDVISRNVAELVKLPKAKEKKDKFGQVIEKVYFRAFSPAERIIFLNEAKLTSLFLIFLTMFYTGLRLGEVLALKWRNVDLEEGVIHVRETVQRVKTPNGPQKTKIIVGSPKTFAGRRTIPLLTIVSEEFKKYREKQLETKEKWGEAYEDKDIVFSTENGNYREPRNFTRSFYNIRNKSGVSQINLHCIRHSFASMLLEKKVHVKIVSCLLGHTDIAVTINTYSHVFPELKTEAIGALDDYTFKNTMDNLDLLQLETLLQND